jgi:NAD(P)-dependent dehydrogenase (short-subunit alcohol dehydrogenase family)
VSLETLSGRTAVITGAGSGIGRAMAQHAAAAGMKVVAADVEREALDESLALLRDAGGDVIGVLTDVSDAESVEALAVSAFDHYGAVHLLHNNAGVLQGGVAWKRTIADWQWSMNVNFWGVLNGIRSFVPRLLEQEERGDADIHIVNTASIAGVTSVRASAPYVVSKFAVAALTECVAIDLLASGSQIGVSCLVPGVVATRIGTSTRNRPGDVPDHSEAPDHWHTADSFDRITVDRGIPPAEAARIVFDRIQANEFWICTTDLYDEILRPRWEAILDHRLPLSQHV